ncbi:MAG: EAL domain-containing protein [Nitrosomonas sp.]|nr:EAL domain-containing protein [Nitrosomonas sp.]
MFKLRQVKKLWYSFTGRMVMGVFLIHLLLVPILFFGFLSIFEHAFQGKFVDRVRNEANLHALIIKEDFNKNEPESEIISHLDEALLNSGVIYAAFTNERNEVIFPTVEFIPPDLSFTEDLFFGQHDDAVYYIAVPVIDDLTGKPLGILQLGYDEQPTIDLIELAYYRGTYFAASYMLISLLLVLFFGQHLSIPIANLRDMAKSIAAGNHAIDLRTDTKIIEIKRLARDFNQMHASMLRQHQEVMDRELRLQAIMDNVAEGIIVLNEDGTIRSFNRAAETIFGINTGAAIGENISILVAPSHKQLLRSFVEAGNEEKLNVWNELQGKRSDGSKFLMEFVVSKIFLNGRKFYTALVRDVTERHEAEVILRKLSRAVESSSSAVIITDKNNCIEYVNSSFTDTTGYTKEEVLGKTPRLLQPTEAMDVVYEEIFTNLKSKGEWKGEMEIRKKNGTLYRNRASISGVRDAQGNLTHFISINDDVSFEYELTEQLNYQARHDALTGLINRREFERLTENLFSTLIQDKVEHALLFMDLDQFKIVNDTCGHAAGDELLRQVSKILRIAVRESDALARVGGDEFAVILRHCSLAQTKRVANTILEAIRDFQFRWEGHAFRIGVSIGAVAISETNFFNFTEVLKQADTACYMAKEAGRNRIHLYQLEDKNIAKRQGEMRWVERIQRGLEDGRFVLYAQAIVPLGNQTGVHYELLIRKIGDQGNLIMPGTFLPAAERYNLMTKLDGWMVKQAFALLNENQHFVRQIDFISINISGQSIADEGFYNFIISQIHTIGVEARKFCFEITETSAIANLDIATQFITTLKKLGCRFALDDFGSGLSSFGYLKSLPVDYLKIDGLFVKDIVDDPIDYAMVKSINEIGHIMGMQTIAEFVENDDIKNKLIEIGVDYAQGYGLGRPVLFEELLARLSIEMEQSDSDNQMMSAKNNRYSVM